MDVAPIDRPLSCVDWHDASLLSRPEGIEIHGDKKTFLLRDPGECEVLANIWARLDGARTLDELSDSFPSPEARRHARSLLRLLLDEGVIRPIARIGRLPSRLERFSAVAEHLAQHVREPAEAIERLREAPLLLTGRGAMSVAVAHALMTLGASRLCATAPQEHAHRFDALARQFGTDSIAVRCHDECFRRLDRFDCVVVADEDFDMTALRAVERSCRAAGKGVFVAGIRDRIGFAGPMGRPDADCLACAIELLLERADVPAPAPETRGDVTSGPAAVGIVAAEAAGAVLREITSGPHRSGRLLRLVHVPTLSVGVAGLGTPCRCGARA